MKHGEKIVVERLENGLYKFTYQNTIYIGGAASTIIMLANAVFSEEASEVPAQAQVSA